MMPIIEFDVGESTSLILAAAAVAPLYGRVTVLQDSIA
jgi:hypothetical protein